MFVFLRETNKADPAKNNSPHQMAIALEAHHVPLEFED
jgi:hypothetical protein